MRAGPPNLHFHVARPVVERDLEPMLKGRIFSGIRSDEARFMQLCVEGGTLVWPGGADLSPDMLIWGGLPPTDTDVACGMKSIFVTLSCPSHLKTPPTRDRIAEMSSSMAKTDCRRIVNSTRSSARMT